MRRLADVRPRLVPCFFHLVAVVVAVVDTAHRLCFLVVHAEFGDMRRDPEPRQHRSERASKVVRPKPLATAISQAFGNSRRAARATATFSRERPVAPGNTKSSRPPSPVEFKPRRSRARSSKAMAAGDKWTMNIRPDLTRSEGMVHVAFSRSISSHDASLASPGRTPVSSWSLIASLVVGHMVELSSVPKRATQPGVVCGVDRPRPVRPRVVDATHGIEAFDVVALDREADQSAQGPVHLRGAGRGVALARPIDARLQRGSRQATDLDIADPSTDVEVEVVLEDGDRPLAHGSAALARAAQALVGQPFVEYFSHGRPCLRRRACLSGRDRRMIGFARLCGRVFDLMPQQLRTCVCQGKGGIAAHRQPVTCAIHLDPILPVLGESFSALTDSKVEAGIDHQPLLAASRSKLQRLDLLVGPPRGARHRCLFLSDLPLLAWRPSAFLGFCFRYRFGYHFRQIPPDRQGRRGRQKPSIGAACRPISDVSGFPRKSPKCRL